MSDKLDEISLRDKTMAMKNWAVVGATDKKDKFGYKIYKRLKEYDYNVYPVNPSLDQIDGDKCYPNLNSIDAKIEVVDMVVNSSIGLEVMKDVKNNEIEYVWLQPGARSQKIREFAAKNNIKIIARSIYRELFVQ